MRSLRAAAKFLSNANAGLTDKRAVQNLPNDRDPLRGPGSSSERGAKPFGRMLIFVAVLGAVTLIAQALVLIHFVLK
jgi:hypothetical protein